MNYIFDDVQFSFKNIEEQFPKSKSGRRSLLLALIIDFNLKQQLEFKFLQKYSSFKNSSWIFFQTEIYIQNSSTGEIIIKKKCFIKPKNCVSEIACSKLHSSKRSCHTETSQMNLSYNIAMFWWRLLQSDRPCMVSIILLTKP